LALSVLSTARPDMQIMHKTNEARISVIARSIVDFVYLVFGKAWKSTLKSKLSL